MTTKQKIIHLLESMIDDINHNWTSAYQQSGGIDLYAEEIIKAVGQSAQRDFKDTFGIFLENVPYNIGNKVLSDEEREQIANDVMANVFDNLILCSPKLFMDWYRKNPQYENVVSSKLWELYLKEDEE